MSGITNQLNRLKSRIASGKKAVEEAVTATQSVFEKHNIVFTIGASVASAGAAWAGYMARQHHQSKLENRLQSIEEAMASVHEMEAEQVKALARSAVQTSSGLSYKTCVATALTTFFLGYGLGFRGGRMYTLKRIPRVLESKQPLLGLQKVVEGGKVGE